jgi:Tfp pilus assembly protein PilV
MTSSRRGGFSLLEVMLATGILLGCLVVLSELANLGRIHASAAQDEAMAARLCQNQLHAILSGLAPAAAVAKEPLAEAPGWWYSVEVEPAKQRGVAVLRITVGKDEEAGGRPVEFSLVRWIRDPKWTPRATGLDSDGPRLPPGFRGRRNR